jgi:hypothetical protein
MATQFISPPGLLLAATYNAIIFFDAAPVTAASKIARDIRVEASLLQKFHFLFYETCTKGTIIKAMCAVECKNSSKVIF